MSCTSRSTKISPRAAETGRRGMRALLAGYRLGLLAAAFFCLHLATLRREAGRDAALDVRALDAVKAFLPAAVALGPPEGDDRVSAVLDAKGEPVGWAAQTFPEARPVTGYAGPSNLLVVFDRTRRVAGVRLLASADTSGHVVKVVESPGFLSQWNGRSQASLGVPGTPLIISGASLTSEAMARGVAARFGATGMDQWFPGEVAIEAVRAWFPEAASLSGTRVLAADGKDLGTLLRASRMGVSVRGFQGASDVLLALDPAKRTVLGAALHGSRDNEPYTSDVRDGLLYDQPFAGMPVKDALAVESGTAVMVSGASRTAESVEETVKEMLRRHLAPPPFEPSLMGPRDAIALAWIAAGLVIGLGPWRGRKRVRTIFAATSVLTGGLWLGLMTGQDQWIKWSMRGSAAGTALPLLALTAAALLVPAAFGKNVYCAQLCPHGAAQQLVGQLRKRRFALPPKLHRALAAMPWLTLALLWLLAFLGVGFPFANAEPFEVWSTGFVALVPVMIFAGGLIAAAFLPQAYCHYGCPTGAVLKFLASSPGRWTRRDAIAGAAVTLGWLALVLP
jgi:NosR/NirI family nitrous oxide reductase transcriptional regulator